MKTKFFLTAILSTLLYAGSSAQPLVYKEENTGKKFPKPQLPALSQLPIIEPLTDPFMWSNSNKRSTAFRDWEKRRNEIKAEVEKYEIGNKPDRPDSITASHDTTVLTVKITRNGQTLVLSSKISLPEGSGPFPAIIGMNSLSGSIPAAIFTARNIARITFTHNQVTTYNNPRLTDPFYKMYPGENLDNAGQYSAWAWGVSRIIDGLELVKDKLPIDLSHLGVTGCSYAGKMALFAGALDERIALTIAQESGGGGATAWRVSETLGNVEKLGATSNVWFSNEMFQFSGDNVSRLPLDHHELMAMVAPRALLVTGNTDYTWLANPSCYVASMATKEVYKTLGIADRFGFYIDGGHQHCAIPSGQSPAVEAFVDKFLIGKKNINTDTIMKNPYPDLDYKRWIDWWGKEKAILPEEPIGVRIWLEAECAALGSNWQRLNDTAASNGSYVVVNGLNSSATAPANAADAVIFTVTIDSAATYNLAARVNCPSANDDSYWVKVDNGAFTTVNGLTTSGWQWQKLITGINFTKGEHTITIAYREDGAQLDKIVLTTNSSSIHGKGDKAGNCK